MADELAWKPPQGPLEAAHISHRSFLHSAGGEPLVLDKSAGRWQLSGKEILYQSFLQDSRPVQLSWSTLIRVDGASGRDAGHALSCDAA